MTVDNVAPLVVHLASSACTETRQIFSVGCGHVARFAVGIARGWCAPPTVDAPTSEDVAANLAASDLDDLAFPESMNDATRFVARRLAEVP